MIAHLHSDEQLAAEAASAVRRVAFKDLAEGDQALIRAALDITRASYSPYSGFAVGAAVKGRSGRVHVGTNFENASYGITMCAEVAAITAANTAGEHTVDTIAVIGHKYTTPESVDQPVTPCGRCRQMIAEIAQSGGTNVRVLSCSGDLSNILETTIGELLPEAFGPASMGMVDQWTRTRPKLAAAVDKLKRR
jgi:cytidine deaminase